MQASTSGGDAERQLAVFIRKFSPIDQRLIRAVRNALRKRFPTANELVYDNYNALAIGWSPNERTSEVIVSLAIYARGVNLYFYYGAALADPHKLLQGAGNRGRFIRMDDVTMLDRPEVAALIRTAIQFGDTPLPNTGRGHTVIKSISQKQRSRRPR